MSKVFNLLLLHQDRDLHPRSWICVHGANIQQMLLEKEQEVLKQHRWSREKLARKISQMLSCALSTSKNMLHQDRLYYPIPFILTLAKLGDTRKKTKFLSDINEVTEILKVNSASAKPITLPKKLNENLAKILGAFMADGSLSEQIVIECNNREELEQIKLHLEVNRIHFSEGRSESRKLGHYVSTQVNTSNATNMRKLLQTKLAKFHSQSHNVVELTENYKDSVDAFIKWVEEEFKISPAFYTQKTNAWRVAYSNKILSRYLTTFFGVMPGPKTYSAHEPDIICEANLRIQKEFAKGVLMFDGSVNNNSQMSLSLKSKGLIDSISTIFTKDGIRHGKTTNKRGEHCLYTTSENEPKKILQYFEPNTQKNKLLLWQQGDLTQRPVPKPNSRKTNFNISEVLDLIRLIEGCDIAFLETHFKRSRPIITTYLRILQKQRKIHLTKKPRKLYENTSQETSVFLSNHLHKQLFQKLLRNFGTYKKAAYFLNIHKGTLSAWKLKKNRIPIYILKRTLEILDISKQTLAENIRETDRNIVEITK